MTLRRASLARAQYAPRPQGLGSFFFLEAFGVTAGSKAVHSLLDRGISLKLLLGSVSII